MDAVEVVFERMKSYAERDALFWRGNFVRYSEFLGMVDRWTDRLTGHTITAGTVCSFIGDYSPETVALIFALIRQQAILVPFTYAIEHEMPPLAEIAGVQACYRFDTQDNWTLETYPDRPQNALVASFRDHNSPGLIVFTSGSTGEPKGILHDVERVMRKFAAERDGWRTVLFLMMDHFGGFNTLLSVFAYGGTAICVDQRTPEAVCRAIEQAGATLLPTTPTFLNLLIASGSYRDFDLSSVRLITYGTELMSETTLRKVQSIFSDAQLKQTYGLSELGVLRSRSESDSSVWVRVGGEGFEIKIVDGTLWVRSEANMIGYLNAPNPFDEEGWMSTGDRVEVREDYIRFLGRQSEMINVGGQKVFPIEVENVLLQDENVLEATVYGAKHPLMGHVLHARVTLAHAEESQAVAERLRKLCLAHLARYKVPVKLEFVTGDDQRNTRFKKIRRGFDDTADHA